MNLLWGNGERKRERTGRYLLIGWSFSLLHRERGKEERSRI